MDPIARFEQAQQAVLAAYDIDAERRFVDVPCVGQAQVLETGEGPPLLFVIGGGAPGALWAPLVAKLGGYRRIVVDRPGFGLTDTVPQQRDGLRALARTFLRQTLDALGLDTVTIVANSMGAWWSTQLALAHPERVRAMAHIGCPALLLGTSAPAPMRLLGVRGLGRLLIRLQPASAKTARRTFAMMGDPLGEDAGGRALTELMVRLAQLPAYADAWADLLHAVVRPRGQRPAMAITEAELRLLDLPLLYVWGDRDPFGDQDVGRAAAAIAPRARFVAVAGGHVPWVGAPEAVATPIRGLLTAHVPGARRAH